VKTEPELFARAVHGNRQTLFWEMSASVRRRRSWRKCRSGSGGFTSPGRGGFRVTSMSTESEMELGNRSKRLKKDLRGLIGAYTLEQGKNH
jgi:hypothetical protein